MCKGTGLLAKQENFGHVVECGCGIIHVTVGPMTLALDFQSLRKLNEMLEQATISANTQAEEITDPRPLLVHSSHLAVKKVMKLKH